MKKLILSALILAGAPMAKADPNLEKGCVSPTVRVAANAINERPNLQPRPAATTQTQRPTTTR